MKISQQSRARKQAEQSRDREGAETQRSADQLAKPPSFAREHMELAEDVSGRGNRSLTVAAQLSGTQASGVGEKAEVVGDVAGRRNRSLTVAARLAKTKSAATPGLPAPATGARAYFITFSCYGVRLHGDAAGSVDPRNNVFGTPIVTPNFIRESSERGRMDQPQFELDMVRRGRVLQAILEVCAHRGWWLFAAHVRATHVHVIVQAGDPPEKVMSDFKTYSSRYLNEGGLDEPARKRWARHGSTRYLWEQEDLEGAIRYVLHDQGEPMATYAGPGVTKASRVGGQAEVAGDVVERRNRSLTVAAQLGGTQASGVGGQAKVAGGAVGRGNRSLTVAARLGGTQASEVDEQAKVAGDVTGRRNRSLTVAAQLNRSAGFTMMEIAISLAVIGIALVAIIGVLPIGMNVQQSNREETVIGQDANVLMEDIRRGSLGSDELTNYIYAISNYWGYYQPGQAPYQGVNGYTYGSVSVDTKYPAYTRLPASYQVPITNGANIIGLLSTPEYVGANGDGGGDVPGQPIPSLYYGGISNHIVAYCYSISGPAIEKPPQDNPILQQDSFGYHLFCVNAPTTIDTNLFFQAPNGFWSETKPYVAGSTVFFNWMYWTCPNGALGGVVPGTSPVWQMSPNYTFEQALNLHELRLTFEWPALAKGNVGPSRETFRTLVAGQLLHQPLLFVNSGNPVNSVWYNSNLWCYLPETFTNTP